MSTGTSHKEFWQALQRPMDGVKQRKGAGGRMLSYVDARQVQIRLDEVCGPENWKATYREVFGPKEHLCGVVCSLSIRIPGETEWITKESAGGWKTMTEAGSTDCENTFKTAYSDALKRSFCEFGGARELYGVGNADFDLDPASDERPAPRPQAQPQQYSSGQNGNGYQGNGQAQQGGYRRRQPGEEPMSPGDLFFWAKEKSEETGRDLLGAIKTFGKKENISWKCAEWSHEHFQKCYAMLKRGLGDSPVAAPPAPAPVQAPAPSYEPPPSADDDGDDIPF